MEDFEPTIIAFVCNWCTYTAADLAGTSRLSYPTNVRIVRVPCSSRVNPSFIIRAFQRGADGVIVAGCHPGDCHYINGNYKARRRVKLLKAILPGYGFDEKRIKLTWIGASDGIVLARTVRDMVDEVKELGPSAARSAAVV